MLWLVRPLTVYAVYSQEHVVPPRLHSLCFALNRLRQCSLFFHQWLVHQVQHRHFRRDCRHSQLYHRIVQLHMHHILRQSHRLPFDPIFEWFPMLKYYDKKSKLYFSSNSFSFCPLFKSYLWLLLLRISMYSKRLADFHIRSRDKYSTISISSMKIIKKLIYSFSLRSSNFNAFGE